MSPDAIEIESEAPADLEKLQLKDFYVGEAMKWDAKRIFFAGLSMGLLPFPVVAAINAMTHASICKGVVVFLFVAPLISLLAYLWSRRWFTIAQRRYLELVE